MCYLCPIFIDCVLLSDNKGKHICLVRCHPCYFALNLGLKVIHNFTLSITALNFCLGNGIEFLAIFMGNPCRNLEILAETLC